MNKLEKSVLCSHMLVRCIIHSLVVVLIPKPNQTAQMKSMTSKSNLDQSGKSYVCVFMLDMLFISAFNCVIKDDNK